MSDPFENRLKLISGQEMEGDLPEEDSSPDVVNFGGAQYVKVEKSSALRIADRPLKKRRSRPPTILREISWSAKKRKWWNFWSRPVTFKLRLIHGCQGPMLGGPPKDTYCTVTIQVRKGDNPEAAAEYVSYVLQRERCALCNEIVGLLQVDSEKLLKSAVADFVRRVQEKKDAK